MTLGNEEKGRKAYSRREFIEFAALSMGAVACGVPGDNAPEVRNGRPNIVFILADQMRYSALGCMGNNYIRTPNLDSLAGQGALFTNAFSSSPVCSPYRAQLMTGKYSHKTGVVHNNIKLPEDQISIAELLKRAGYATGYIGKWHLEGGKTAPEGDIRRSGFVPPGEARQGWDYWAALECSHNYYKTKYYRDSEEPIPVMGYEPDVQTDLAIDYMRRNKSHPFCLMLSWGPPHPPYKPPEEYAVYVPEEVPLRPNVSGRYEQSARGHIADYYGLVTSLDNNIKRLVGALDDLGIADNTIVCFTSDHGDMLGSHGEVQKQRPWEESIHIPFIMRYPAKIQARQRKDLIFNSVDVMPTLLGFCGVSIPTDVQGEDLSAPILSGSGSGPDSAFFAITSHGAGPGWNWRGVRTDEWMYAATATDDWVLYNVIDDPYEMKNLITDPKYKQKKQELRKRLKEWIDHTGDSFNL